MREGGEEGEREGEEGGGEGEGEGGHHSDAADQVGKYVMHCAL